VVDFIKEADRAERRPSTYVIEYSHAGGSLLPAFVGPAPGRLTWTLPMPRGGRFEARLAAVSAPVRARVGISDSGTYEQLGEATLVPDAPWMPMTVDLSAFAGWKLSLFYRPDLVQWRFVLSADAAAGVPGTIVWGTPAIVAPAGSAREYAVRRARLAR
jgi:hypothetical protein